MTSIIYWIFPSLKFPCLKNKVVIIIPMLQGCCKIWIFKLLGMCWCSKKMLVPFFLFFPLAGGGIKGKHVLHVTLVSFSCCSWITANRQAIIHYPLVAACGSIWTCVCPICETKSGKNWSCAMYFYSLKQIYWKKPIRHIWAVDLL